MQDSLKDQLIEINNKLGSMITLIKNKLPKESTFDGGKLGFLAVVVALSSYIAFVRLSIIEAIQRNTIPRKNKRKRKFVLLFLIPADFCLVFGGLFLSYDLLSEFIVGEKEGWDVFRISCIAFAVAIGTLAIHHIVAWCGKPTRKFVKWLCRRKRRRVLVYLDSVREWYKRKKNAMKG